MVVQARTLEFYGQYGFAGEVIEQGVIAETAHVREGGSSGSREVLSISFKEMGAGLSPYPFALAYPQDDHERFLIEKLKDTGCEVEWGAKLAGFSEGESSVRATIEHNTGRVEQAESTYICGCDGARSCVRETLQLGFPGGTYEQLFYVADVKIARGFSRGSVHQPRQTHSHFDVPGAVEWNAALDRPRTVRTFTSRKPRL